MMNSRTRIVGLIVGLCVFYAPPSAQAWQFDYAGAKVRVVQVDAMPDKIAFKTDNPGTAQCENSADWLIYNGTVWQNSNPIAATRSAYAALLAALHSGSTVDVFGDFGVGGECFVGAIYFRQ
jgi:hypothetical protein